MSSITKTAKGYRAQVYVKGQRDSATFRTQREATSWAAARETEFRTLAAESPISRHTLGDALRKYGEEETPKHRGRVKELIRLESMQRDAGIPSGKLIASLAPDDFGIWRNLRLRQVAPGTVLREMGLLSSVLECARREWRWITVNVLKDVRRPTAPPHRDVLITRPQIRKILSVMGYRLGRCDSITQATARAFLIALRTGMRAGEICALTWAQVKPGFLSNVGTKTWPRDVPLTPKALRVIESMRGFDPILVFGVQSQTLDALFRKYRNRAGLSGFTFHDSRHTAATWIAIKIDVLSLCKMFGWSDPKMAMVYYNPTALSISKRLT